MPITIWNGSLPSAAPPDRLIRGETGAQGLIGWVVEVRANQGVQLVLDVEHRHTNRHGVLHGGIMAMLLDSASGYTGSFDFDPTDLPQMLSISMTTQFLAPVTEGQKVTVTGRVTGGGRSTLFLAAELRDAQGVLAATSTGVYRPVKRKG